MPLDNESAAMNVSRLVVQSRLKKHFTEIVVFFFPLKVGMIKTGDPPPIIGVRTNGW